MVDSTPTENDCQSCLSPTYLHRILGDDPQEPKKHTHTRSDAIDTDRFDWAKKTESGETDQSNPSSNVKADASSRTLLSSFAFFPTSHTNGSYGAPVSTSPETTIMAGRECAVSTLR